MRLQPESSINAVIDRLEALGVQGVAPWIALEGRACNRKLYEYDDATIESRRLNLISRSPLQNNCSGV